MCTVLAVQGGQTTEYGPLLTPNSAILQHVCLKMVALVLGRIGIRIRTRLSPILIKAFCLKLPQELAYLSNVTYIFDNVSIAVTTFG